MTYDKVMADHPDLYEYVHQIVKKDGQEGAFIALTEEYDAHTARLILFTYANLSTI